MLSLYQDAIIPMTWSGAFALLLPPYRIFGRNVCHLLAAGSDSRLDARVLLEDVKDKAREMGADTLMAGTWRNPKAIARKFDAVIDSVNLRWTL